MKRIITKFKNVESAKKAITKDYLKEWVKKDRKITIGEYEIWVDFRKQIRIDNWHGFHAGSDGIADYTYQVRTDSKGWNYIKMMRFITEWLEIINA